MKGETSAEYHARLDREAKARVMQVVGEAEKWIAEVQEDKPLLALRSLAGDLTQIALDAHLFKGKPEQKTVTKTVQKLSAEIHRYAKRLTKDFR